jgi:hypothetical protein
MYILIAAGTEDFNEDSLLCTHRHQNLKSYLKDFKMVNYWQFEDGCLLGCCTV